MPSQKKRHLQTTGTVHDNCYVQGKIQTLRWRLKNDHLEPTCPCPILNSARAVVALAITHFLLECSAPSMTGWHERIITLRWRTTTLGAGVSIKWTTWAEPSLLLPLNPKEWPRLRSAMMVVVYSSSCVVLVVDDVGVVSVVALQ